LPRDEATVKKELPPIELDLGNGQGAPSNVVSELRPDGPGLRPGKGIPGSPRGVRSKSMATGSRLRRFIGRIWWAIKRLCLVGLGLAVGGAIGLFLYVRHTESNLPSATDLKGTYRPAQVTRILARDGTVLAELFTERRTVVALDALPAHVKLAVLGAEDATFYEHEGLNYLGIFRAVLVNLRSGHVRQGGSTITQQVVKNVLLDSERSLKRKVREALLARKLEAELTKDEILEIYLNHIYFGNGRYGIEEAAKGTFGKSAKDLSIAEAALLAGVIACPETCSPRRDAKKALERRGLALGRMLQKQFLTQAQFDVATAEPVRLVAVTETTSELAPEVVAIAKRTLHELEPERSAYGGFTITTTIDPRLQAFARKALRDNIRQYDKRHALAGALKAPRGVTTRPNSKDKSPSKAPTPPKGKDSPFEGTPDFEHHRVYVATVEAVDDEAGTIDVRVGTVHGSFKLDAYPRYNPAKLKPSMYAPVGAWLRVSLLGAVAAPASTTASGVPAAAAGVSTAQAPVVVSLPIAASTKVPVRLELGPEAAFVAIDVRSRDVLALVGSYEALAGGLDRSTQSRRQPGSTFKPIVYSYALHSHRFTAASLIDVTPAVFGDYRPSNYEGWIAKEPLRLREVLAKSVNIGAVRVLEDVGPQNVVTWAQALGFTTPLKPDLSLALGSYEVEPIELVNAYATFAAGGMYEGTRIITKIVGPDGKELELKPRAPSRRVLEENEAYLMTHMLGSVVDHGTATGARVLARPVAGKTGTSNLAKDTWFAGFSTDIAAVSWVGYDDGKPLGAGEAGGVTALPAWVQFMKQAHEGRPAIEFPRPSGLVVVKVDTKTGKLPYPDDPTVMDEIFLPGTEPLDVSELPVADGGVPDAGPQVSDGDGGVLPTLPATERSP
jgi:penicillin-binding protein 1A